MYDKSRLNQSAFIFANAIRNAPEEMRAYLRDLFASTFTGAAENFDTLAESESGETIKSSKKQSYRGTKSSAENIGLDTALQMEKDGADSEEIRQATGWFRGYDGQWRIEIDDSSATYDKPITVSDVQQLREIIKAHNGERVSINDFTSADIQKAQKWAYKFYKELGTKSPFFRAWFGDWRASDTAKLELPLINATSAFEAGKEQNADTGKTISWGNTVKAETFNHAVKEKISVSALKNIREIVKNAILLDTVVSDNTSKSKMPNTAFMHSFYTIYDGELLKMYVEEALSTKGNDIFNRAYELKDIKKVADIPNGVHAENSGLTDETSAMSSISDLYSLVKAYDKDFHAGKEVSPYLLNEDGTPKVWYHQTENDFTVFNVGREGAGTRDNETPFGIFLKSSDRDIGLRGKKQMSLYAEVRAPFVVKNRYELVQKLTSMSVKYAELSAKSKAIDKEYSEKEKAAAQDFKDYVIKNSQSENRKSRQEMYKDPEFQRVLDAEDKVVEEWTEKAAKLSKAVKSSHIEAQSHLRKI